MDSSVERKLSDPVIAKKVVFLMYHVYRFDELDEVEALQILDILGQIERGEEVSTLWLPKKCNHLDLKFSDNINRTYDEINGLVEI